MKTIKIILADDGSVVSSSVGFQINQYSYNDTLINIYVPSEILDNSRDEYYWYSNNVVMAMKYTSGGGTQRIGNPYLFTFVKNNVVIENKTYTLFERKMPREFTLYAGLQQFCINVVLTRTVLADNTVQYVGNVTSANWEQLINSGINMVDSPIEVDTDLSTLVSQVNSLLADIVLKQDKTDLLIQVNIANGDLDTTSNVVAALNYLNQRVGENYTKNNTQDGKLNSLDGRVSTLENEIITGFRYCGMVTSPNDPSSVALDNFITSQGLVKKNGDIVIWTKTISGATDISYRCLYSNNTWDWYEIPTVELATNNEAGLVQGNYGNDTTSNVLASIIGGKIVDIYYKKPDSTYESIRDRINALQTYVNNIISGSQVVGKSTYATYDSTEENKVTPLTIDNKFLTKQYGATKVFVQNYALPRQFNDVYRLDLYLDEFIDVPTYQTNYKTVPTSLGDVLVESADLTVTNDMTYDLNSKNSFRFDFPVSFTSAIDDVSFTLNIYKYATPTNILLATATTDVMSFDTNIHKITIADYFNRINDNETIKMSDGDGYKIELTAHIQTSATNDVILYASQTYPTNFSLSTDSYTLCTSQSGIIIHNLTATYDSNSNYMIWELGNLALVDKTIHKFNLTLPVGMTWFDIPANCVYTIQLNGVDIPVKPSVPNNTSYIGDLAPFLDTYNNIFSFIAVYTETTQYGITYQEFAIEDGANNGFTYFCRDEDIMKNADDEWVISDELNSILPYARIMINLSNANINYFDGVIGQGVATNLMLQAKAYRNQADFNNKGYGFVFDVMIGSDLLNSAYSYYIEAYTTMNANNEPILVINQFDGDITKTNYLEFDISGTTIYDYNNEPLLTSGNGGVAVFNVVDNTASPVLYSASNGMTGLQVYKTGENTAKYLQLDYATSIANFYNLNVKSDEIHANYIKNFSGDNDTYSAYGVKYIRHYVAGTGKQTYVDVTDGQLELYAGDTNDTNSVKITPTSFTHNTYEVIDTNNITSQFLTDAEMTTLLSEVFD